MKAVAVFPADRATRPTRLVVPRDRARGARRGRRGRRKNQVVFGTVNAGRDAFEAAIAAVGRFVERWPAAMAGLVTGRYPVERHADLLVERPGGIKNVIAFAG